jgi:hypothetical protein
MERLTLSHTMRSDLLNVTDEALEELSFSVLLISL